MNKEETNFRRSFVKTLGGQVVYMSSMNVVGIPDLYVLKNGRVWWIELKAVTVDLTKKRANANVLKHPFSGPQIEFMKDVQKNGGRGFGVVGWRQAPRKKYVSVLVEVGDMTAKGNVGVDKFLTLQYRDLETNDTGEVSECLYR